MDRKDKLRIVNIGLEWFYHELRRQGAEVVHVRWRPPAGGDKEMIDLLRRIKRAGLKMEGTDS